MFPGRYLDTAIVPSGAGWHLGLIGDRPTLPELQKRTRGCLTHVSLDGGMPIKSLAFYSRLAVLKIKRRLRFLPYVIVKNAMSKIHFLSMPLSWWFSSFLISIRAVIVQWHCILDPAIFTLVQASSFRLFSFKLSISACKYLTMAYVTWDEIRRLRADFLNIQLTESANKYVK